MEKIKTLIIGAGAIGLAIGYEISGFDPDLVVVDKENSFGRHTSSRNSEVIHAGHYYAPGSLKAELCVKGNALLYEFLQNEKIPYRNTGKIIVAVDSGELNILRNYERTGNINGVKGLKLLSKEEVRELESRIKCVAGLYIPSTGIFDTHEFMKCLETGIENNGGYTVYGMEVVSIQKKDDYYMVDFSNGEKFQCQHIVNAAGLWSDQIAQQAGMDIDQTALRLHLCKGEYYKTTKIRDINHLIYPVADPKGVFLGIHLTINLDNEVRFGPNAFYVENIDYRFDESYFEEFHKSINRYLEIDKADLIPDDTGIRPKLQGPNDGFRDFYIREESDNGFPGFVNLIGIESPGLTASLAIAGFVKSKLYDDRGV